MLTELRHFLIKRLAGKDIIVLNAHIVGEITITSVKRPGLVAECTFTQPEEPDEWTVLDKTIYNPKWLRGLGYQHWVYVWRLFVPRVMEEAMRRGALSWWAILAVKLIWPNWQFKTGEE